jgi:hypothetical protein
MLHTGQTAYGNFVLKKIKLQFEAGRIFSNNAAHAPRVVLKIMSRFDTSLVARECGNVFSRFFCSQNWWSFHFVNSSSRPSHFHRTVTFAHAFGVRAANIQ